MSYSKPLSGRLVLDCSALLPGPMIGMLLQRSGARVIKIENPNSPDGSKDMAETFYETLNSQKELRPLNLKDPVDRREFQSLVAKADALIEGFRPQAKRDLGLDERTLLKIQPKLCIASIIGFSKSYIHPDRAGHDLGFQARSGLLSLGEHLSGLPLAALFSVYRGAFLLTAALGAVQKGELGRTIEIVIEDTLMEAQALFINEYKATGELPGPGKALLSGKYPCYRLYRTLDNRIISISSIEHKFWARTCSLLGLQKLEKKGYASGVEGAEVVQEVQQVVGSKPLSHWVRLFENEDCCVEPVLNYSEIDL